MPTGSGLKDKDELGFFSDELGREVETVPSPAESGRTRFILREMQVPVGSSSGDGPRRVHAGSETKESQAIFCGHAGFRGLELNAISGRWDGQEFRSETSRRR